MDSSPIVIASSQSQLVNLLRQAISKDQEIRKPAEALIAQIELAHAPEFFNTLVGIFCDIQEAEIVQLALVLAKNVFVSESAFEIIASTMSEETLTGVQRNLLTRLGDLQLSDATRKGAATLITIVVVRMTRHRQHNLHFHLFGAGNNNANLSTCWPGLFKQLLDVASNESQPIGLRITCLDIYCESAATLLGCTDCRLQLVKFTELILGWLEGAKTAPRFAAAAARCASLLVIAILDPTNFGQAGRDNLDQIGFGLVQAYDDCCASLMSSSSSSSSFASTSNLGLEYVGEFIKAFDVILSEHAAFFIPSPQAGLGARSTNNTKLATRLFESVFSMTEKFAQQRPATPVSIELVENHLTLLAVLCAGLVASNKPLIKGFTQRTFAFCLQLMIAGLDDDFFDLEAWKNTAMPIDDEVTVDSEEKTALLRFHTSASRTLATLVAEPILTVKQLQELVLPYIESAAGKDWKTIACACDLIHVCCDSSLKKTIFSRLDSLMQNIILPALRHEHPFPRFCAARCISIFCSFHCPKFQEKFASTVLPILTSSLIDSDDSNSAQVVPCLEQIASFSVGAIFDELHTLYPDDDAGDDDDDEFSGGNKRNVDPNSFQKDRSRNVATAYLDAFFEPTVNALLASLSKHEDATRKPPFVVNRQVRALNAIAQLGGSRVTNLVTDIIPCLKILVGKYHGLYEENYVALSSNHGDAATPTQLQEFQCLLGSIESAALLFSVLPLDPQNQPELHQSAIEFTMFLIEFLESKKFKTYGATVKYLLRALTCMTEHLRHEISPLLPRFIPTLLSYANIKCEYTECDASTIARNVESVFDEEYGKMSIVRTGDPTGAGMETVIKVPTQMLEVKDLASTILSTLCSSVPDVLYDYVDEITGCAIGLLECTSCDAVRENAVTIFPLLVKLIEGVNKRGQVDAVAITKQEQNHKLGTLAERALLPLFESVVEESNEDSVHQYLEAIRTIIPHRDKIKRANSAGQAAGYVFGQLETIRQNFLDRGADDLSEYVDQLRANSAAEEIDQDEVDQQKEELAERNGVVSSTLAEVNLCFDEWTKLCPTEMCELFAHRIHVEEYYRTTIVHFKEYYDYVAFQERKKNNNNNNNTTTKKNSKKNQEKKAASVEQEPELEMNPAFASCIHANVFAILGGFVQHFPVKSPKFVSVLVQGWPLIELLPLINESHALRCAGWSLGVCFTKWKEYFESQSLADEKSQDGAPSEDLHHQVTNFGHSALVALHKCCIAEIRVSLDATDETDLAAITNLASLFIRLLLFFGEDGLGSMEIESSTSSPSESLKFAAQLAHYFLSKFPLGGDVEESRLWVFPFFAQFLLRFPRHPLFGSESKDSLRPSLISAFEGLISTDVLRNSKVEEQLLTSGLFSSEYEELMRQHLEERKNIC